MTQPSHADILAAITASKKATEALSERVEDLWKRSQERDGQLKSHGDLLATHGDLLARLTDILEAWDTGKRTGQFFVGMGRIVKWAAGILGALAIIGAAAKYAVAHIFTGSGQP